MRKFLIPLLMASVVVPAAASAQDGIRGHRSASERESQSNDRPKRAERAEHSGGEERAVQKERAERPVRTERNVAQVQPAEPGRQDRRVERGQAVAPVQPEQQVRQVERDQATRQVQRVRRTDRDNDGITIRRVPREAQTSPAAEAVVPQGGDRDGFRNGDRTGTNHRWNGDWRRDHRYDWRNHRSRYGSLYRVGRYYDPYGWGYRRFSIGFNLWPSYFGSSFWLNDPWQYRLPPAYGPYRWVRYYNDALLVNIYTGQVVDVVYGFFW